MEVAEATWVLYLLSSLFRLVSSISQGLRFDMARGGDFEGVGVKGACSARLSRVMPEGIPSAADEQASLVVYVQLEWLWL